MKRLFLILTFTIALLPAVLSAQNLRWEEVNPAAAKQLVTPGFEVSSSNEEEGVEIFAANGYIYISTDHEIPVRVVSILGQPLGEGRLKAGTYRMPMKSRGIYIIKAGMATLRVTL